LIREFVLRGKERILRRVSERKNERFWREKRQSERDGSIGVCEAIRKSTIRKIRKIQKSDQERGKRKGSEGSERVFFFHFSAFGQNEGAKNYSNELEKEKLHEYCISSVYFSKFLI
jgi:hypothetical protein